MVKKKDGMEDCKSGYKKEEPDHRPSHSFYLFLLVEAVHMGHRDISVYIDDIHNLTASHTPFDRKEGGKNSSH